LLADGKSWGVKGHLGASHFLLSSGTDGCAGSTSASGVRACGYWFKLSLQPECPLQPIPPQAIRSLRQQILKVQMVLLPPRNELKMGADYEAFLACVLQLRLGHGCAVDVRA